MVKWFRIRQVGFGLTPTSLMGWILTAALVAVIALLRIHFRQANVSMPARFYVFSGLAVVVYSVIAFVTSDRTQ